MSYLIAVRLIGDQQSHWLAVDGPGVPLAGDCVTFQEPPEWAGRRALIVAVKPEPTPKGHHDAST